ncbi:MAG TPA: protein kinase, partial [Kofleriaceae bacterium]
MSAVATASGLPPRLGKYEVLTPLAAGGMAQIYLARTTGIGAFERHVVLKMILPERAHDHTSVQMFLDEARLAASLNHQNVAQVFEVGQDAGVHYLAMEYVHGQDLRALLARAGSEGTRVPLDLALTVIAGAAAGLHHAHERRTPDGVPMGIVHRDVSPSNIMIGYDGAVKLLDFGIAKATMRSVETQSGIIKGKFAYMSPEQCRGRDVDRRSDVFSLGINLYEVTTQHRCFRADSDFDTMHRIVTGDIVPPTRLVLGYPQPLEEIVMRALAVDADDRYANVGELLEAVEGFALEARMPLSTMALGRFMRDMFGDVQEPWLVPGRLDYPAPREHTISNTDGHGEAPMHLPPGMTSMIDVPNVAGPELEDMPSEIASWSVQPYPVYAPHATPAPELYDPRRSVSSMSVANARPSSAPIPLGFTTQTGTGSSSGPSHPSYAQVQAGDLAPYLGQPGASQPQLGFGQTRQGYDSAPGQSDQYPRFVPGYAGHEGGGDAEVDVRSGRRVLYLGLGIVAAGVLVVLLWARHGAETEPPTPDPTAQQGSGPAPKPPEVVPTKPDVATAPTIPPVQVETRPPPLSDEITVHVGSTPPGADVRLGGYAIGKTPLDTHMKRGTGMAT